MIVSPSTAAPFLPEEHSLAAARRAAAMCRGCPLWRSSTQTVFGAGVRDARLMLIGEMPGNEEDLTGRPFVGPAGRLLDQALELAGIDRERAYVTNVVKHFKWTPRGRRRIHSTPNTTEVGACLPWLHLELELVQPRLLVTLGATASRAVLGKSFSVTRERGKVVTSPLASRVVATIHPSALLRIRDRAQREAAIARFVDDFRFIKQALDTHDQASRDAAKAGGPAH